MEGGRIRAGLSGGRGHSPMCSHRRGGGGAEAASGITEPCGRARIEVFIAMSPMAGDVDQLPTCPLATSTSHRWIV